MPTPRVSFFKVTKFSKSIKLSHDFADFLVFERFTEISSYFLFVLGFLIVLSAVLRWHRSKKVSILRMSQQFPHKSISYQISDRDAASSRKKRTTKDSSGSRKPILQRRKRSSIVPLIYEGVDVTPQCLNPYIYESAKERQINILEIRAKESASVVTTLSKTGSQRLKTEIFQQRVDTEAFNPKSYLTSYCEDVFIEPETTDPVRTEISFDYKDDLDLVDSEDNFVIEMEKIPKTISLILSETQTFFLLDLPSSTALKGSEEGEIIEEANRTYEYLTRGKGRNRKVINAEVQTLPTLMKSRDTEAQKSRYKHNATFVSNWEMYDTYNKEEDIVEESSSDEESLTNLHKLNEIASMDSFRLPSDEKQMCRLVKNQKFQDAVAIIERLLANNCYNEQQKRYKGLSDPYEFRENIEYKYRLDLLWTFANEETRKKCVIALSWNPFNEDLLAAGYGKFFFTDRTTTGAVMIWNIKNPTQPERQYNFTSPVSTLAFSNANPNLLAVGFSDGFIRILDVSSRTLNTLKEDSTSFDTAWYLIWYKETDGESLLASFTDGKVSKYRIDSTPTPLKFVQIMRTPMSEGKLKGIQVLGQCRKKEQAVALYATARVVVLHPVDPFLYYIGSNEGVIHKCSTNYYNQHMDLFKAHDGPIHAMKWSPFADKIFVTCGDDCAMRVWADSITDPLLEAKIDMNSVGDVDWSPTHSSVLVSIRSKSIYVWDYQRKMYEAQSETKSPTDCRNVLCKFSPNGRCLVVGDIDGNIHVYALEDMPFPAFFQEDLLKQSIKKVLITRPDILRKFNKLGSLKFDKNQFSNYFN